MSSPTPRTTAKLFTHGRSQAVRLPKEFRFEGTEVRVSRQGNKVILEPIEAPMRDIAAWWAKLDTFLDVPFPDVAEDEPPASDDVQSFD
ncbi:MAG: AbrB/MazE/SpoVT family DNA-binding domain-containing protein [Ancalomicrobiaceae bacterium]|nr:AbrB/MazE/SpoVT family DNA-binding domain-containing protein [Ancalomicrobiaceae bacterium]